jgi:hypothetical protein
MSPLKLFASIRERRRRSSQQRIEEEGAEISRRLRELLAAPVPTRDVEAPFAKARSENDSTCV